MQCLHGPSHKALVFDEFSLKPERLPNLSRTLRALPHILSVSRKISKSIGIIYKSSFCLPKTSLHCLYYSLVYPYLIYCVSVWGSTYQSNLSRVFILQKKIIRIISKVSFDSHTDVLFKEHGILKFFDIYFYQIGKFMYLFIYLFIYLFTS